MPYKEPITNPIGLWFMIIAVGVFSVSFVWYLIRDGAKKERKREKEWREMYPLSGGDDPEDAIIMNKASKWQKAKSN